MPSPRAVLIDIHDLNLDPTYAYTNTKASGRLALSSSDKVIDATPTPVSQQLAPASEAKPQPVIEQLSIESLPEAELQSEPLPDQPEAELQSEPLPDQPEAELQSEPLPEPEKTRTRSRSRN